MFCLYLLLQNIKQPLFCFVYISFYKILSKLCFVLFISPLQNIKQPLFCFVYISFYKILSNLCFVLFCLYLLLQNIKQPSVLFCLYLLLQNIKQPLFCFCLYLLYKMLCNFCFVLFISPIQNIKQPLFCLFTSPFTKY